MISRALALLCLMLLSAGASAAEGVGKKKKSKKDEYEGSKYKSYRVLTDEEPRTYRFDENGQPIPARKPLKKKKKRLSTRDSGDCAEDPTSESCEAKPEGEPQP